MSTDSYSFSELDGVDDQEIEELAKDMLPLTTGNDDNDEEDRNYSNHEEQGPNDSNSTPRLSSSNSSEPNAENDTAEEEEVEEEEASEDEASDGPRSPESPEFG